MDPFITCNWEGIAAEEAPMADALARWFKQSAVRTVYDLGCGPGTYVLALRHYGIEAWGCDFDSRVQTLGEGFSHFDLTCAAPLPLFSKKVDVALCLEVGEHLPEEAADRLVNRCLEASNTVVFSAAAPGQGWGWTR